MSEGLESLGKDSLGEDPRGGRPYFLLEERDLSRWDVSGVDLGLFTLLLAIDAHRYPDELLSALAERFRKAGLGYLCAWGPGCSRVHALFDLAFIEEEEQGVERPFLTTTDHDEEPLAEALWYAIDLAFHGDVRHPAESAVVIGTDNDEWGAEIRAWLADPDELRRHVVDDLPM